MDNLFMVYVTWWEYRWFDFGMKRFLQFDIKNLVHPSVINMYAKTDRQKARQIFTFTGSWMAWNLNESNIVAAWPA